jgi:hypothetical protein
VEQAGGVVGKGVLNTGDKILELYIAMIPLVQSL